MNDVVHRLLVMKRSFFKTRNDSQCFLAVSEDFFSLERACHTVEDGVLFQNVCLRMCAVEMCMIVKGIEQDVLKTCAECLKNLI